MIEDKNNLPELPKGWVWTKLGEVTILGAGNPAPQGKEYFENGIYPFVRVQDMGNLGNNVYLYDTRDNINSKAIEKRKLFPKGAVLFTKSGMSILLNQRAILGRDMYVVSHIGVAIPLDGIPSEWVHYFLKTIDFKNLTHATTLPSLQLSKVQEIPIPFPPLPEQHRIVAKIEGLFTKRDVGVEALEKAKAQLRRHRQAVLKYAFEGKLTEEWRETHKDVLEPASVLLERIKEERKRDVKGKCKLPPVDTSELPELKEGWVGARLNIICDKIQDGSHFSPKIQYKTPGKGRYLYITAKNIREDGIDLSGVTYVDYSFHKSIYERCNPEKGDVLLVKDGVKTGVATINNREEEFSLLSSVALFKSNKNALNSCYLKYFLNSPIGFKMTTGKMTGTAIKRIILDKIRMSCIPLPPLLEQHKIVEEIERRLSGANKLEKVVEQNLKKSERLRQSILKTAFEGKLVPQDPSNEPAEKLLERIKAEKSKRDVRRKVKRRIKRKRARKKRS